MSGVGSPQVPASDALLTPADFATYLGIRPRTFATWRAAGKLPPADLSIGKVVRWRRATIDRWLRQQTEDVQL